MSRGTGDTIFIDPSYSAYYEDRLFSSADSALNRDGNLAPFGRLRDALNQRGITVHTADYLPSHDYSEAVSAYYSFGMLDNCQKLSKLKNVRMRGFIMLEPPVVAPNLYRSLPELTRAFDHVYLHNVSGDGFSLKGVDTSRLRKLYWPQPYDDVLSPYWENTARQRRLVVINGNHIPRSFHRQLYGRRIEAMAVLAKAGAVDLYGHGWEKWWLRSSMWHPYWLNRSALISIYKGPCASKYAVLSQYAFCLCFENMYMEGYLTEKLFDCLYAGTIPVYLGASDIDDLVPTEAYVDSRKYASWVDLWDDLRSMSNVQIESMKEAGRKFIRSNGMSKYYNALPVIFSDSFK